MKLKIFEYNVLRPWLWRWHRRAGLAAALVLALVTVTGLLLNHTSDLGLGKKYVKQTALLAFYGIQNPELMSFKSGDQWLSSNKENQIYLNSEFIAECRGGLVGALAHKDYFWLACQQQLMIFNRQGDLLDKITAAYGLPVPVQQFGICEGQLCISTEKRVFVVNSEQITFSPMIVNNPSWARTSELPESIRNELIEKYRGQGLSWERVFLDIHSGRVFGTVGVWVVDIAAVLLFFLSVSGFVLWCQYRVRKRSR
ncbi:MAG: hypothetical protein ACI92E_000457 [Oceanicoccus sp.]|jgi:hypothetical protein